MKKLAPLIILLALLSCNATNKLGYSNKTRLWNLKNLSSKELKMANDLLGYGLEHEALYSLLDTLKPISSLGFPLSYPLAKAGEMKDGDRDIVDLGSDSVQMALNELKSWNRILKALSTDDLEFSLIPFKKTWQGKRNLQIVVCQKDLLAKLINQKSEFFGQWGFTSNSNVSTVLTALEFEDRNDRYRAYGYLFGYPEHAVDFFVNASISEEETGEFVQRDFFRMPVAIGKRGYFTYAIPKGYIPDQKDSSIYHLAAASLKRYELLKSKYINSEKQVDALRLISDYW